MKKRIFVGLMVMVLMLSILPIHSAGAAPLVVTPLSNYCLGDELYAFTKVASGYDIETFKLSLLSDDMKEGGVSEILPIKKTNTIVRYLFLIDRSGSMYKHMGKVNAYIGSIMDSEKQEAFYTIASFGEKFEIVKENLTDKNAVKSTLDSFSYMEQMTDPYSGVENALKFLDGYSRRSGDLINLVLITDGDPDFGDEDGNVKEDELAKSAADKIVHSPEIIVSTLCTDEWDPIAKKAFTKGNGIHSEIVDENGAIAAGEKITGFTDKLHRIRFKLAETPTNARSAAVVKLDGTTPSGQMASFEVELSDIANLGMFYDGSVTPEPEMTPEPEETAKPEKTPKPSAENPDDSDKTKPEDGKGDKQEDDKDDGNNNDKDENNKEDGTTEEEQGITSDGAIVSGGAAGSSGGSGKGSGLIAGLPLWVILTAGGVLLLLIIIIIILAAKSKKKKNNNNGAYPPYQQANAPYQQQAGGMNAGAGMGAGANAGAGMGAAGAGVGTGAGAAGAGAGAAGITMKLEVISGNCVSQGMIFTLVDELYIGSDASCAIQFADASVAPVNSKISFRNGMIYIEDLNSMAGTAIGGMRIQGSNRLRSGDVVSIGNVAFCMKF